MYHIIQKMIYLLSRKTLQTLNCISSAGNHCFAVLDWCLLGSGTGAYFEFGPGSGHNALYTAHLQPERYDLVDGNPKGAKETRKRLANLSEANFNVHQSLFEEFHTDHRFDLVWAENCVAGQREPFKILGHIKKFVDEQGVLVVSITNGVSILSEAFRRLLHHRFLSAPGEVQDQAVKLIPYYEPHLQHLKGMSRPTVDWILDNIIQPMHDRKLVSLPDLIECLQDNFDVYGNSPKFFTDGRWYKNIVGENRGFNSSAMQSYYQTNLNLLDYREEFPSHSAAFGKRLEELGTRSWDLMCQIEQNDLTEEWQGFFGVIEQIIDHIEKLAPATVAALGEATDLLQGDNPHRELQHFPQWWGRGTQYVSLIRR